MRGQDLYQLLLNSLDLPESLKASYLDSVLKKYSVSAEDLTVEILREIVADFLQETILELDQNSDQQIAQNQ